MLNLNHKKLEVWAKSLLLIKEIYKLTDKLPKEENYGLTIQMRRAVVSVASNLSEGASRTSGKERKRFYEISRSSLVELDTQMEITLLLNYLSLGDLRYASQMINEVFAMLTVLKANT